LLRANDFGRVESGRVGSGHGSVNRPGVWPGLWWHDMHQCWLYKLSFQQHFCWN